MRAREQPSEQWRSGARRKSKVRKNKRAKENKRAKSKEQKGKRMRRPGIEPGASRWQRDILPLNQRRFAILQTHTQIHYTAHKPHTQHYIPQHTNHTNHTTPSHNSPPHTNTNIQYTHTDSETRRLGDSETRRLGNAETRKRINTTCHKLDDEQQER